MLSGRTKSTAAISTANTHTEIFASVILKNLASPAGRRLYKESLLLSERVNQPQGKRARLLSVECRTALVFLPRREIILYRRCVHIQWVACPSEDYAYHFINSSPGLQLPVSGNPGSAAARHATSVPVVTCWIATVR